MFLASYTIVATSCTLDTGHVQLSTDMRRLASPKPYPRSLLQLVLTLVETPFCVLTEELHFQMHSFKPLHNQHITGTHIFLALSPVSCFFVRIPFHLSAVKVVLFKFHAKNKSPLLRTLHLHEHSIILVEFICQGEWS